VLNLFGGGRMFFDQVDEIAGPIDDFVNPDDDVETDDTPPTDDTGSDLELLKPVIGDIDQLDTDLDHADTPSDSPTRQVVAPI
jgi:hypothetical protein